MADIPAIYEATAGYRAHVCNVGRATWLGVRETAQRIVDDHNRAVAWRAASATAPVALAADELAAIGARAVTYERAAQAYATASHGAPSRVRRLEMEDAAHDSAADVPALLAHIAALDAAHTAAVAAAVAAETARCIAVADAASEKHATTWTKAQHTAVAAVAWWMRPDADAIAARAGAR